MFLESAIKGRQLDHYSAGRAALYMRCMAGEQFGWLAIGVCKGLYMPTKYENRIFTLRSPRLTLPCRCIAVSPTIFAVAYKNAHQSLNSNPTLAMDTSGFPPHGHHLSLSLSPSPSLPLPLPPSSFMNAMCHRYFVRVGIWLLSC